MNQRQAIEARLAEARRRFAQARGRAVLGDPDDREQERAALQEIDAARAELQRLGGAALRQFEP